MPTVKSLEDLKRIREEALQKRQVKAASGEANIVVAMGTCGIASGAKEVMDALLAEIEEAKVNDVIVTTSGCMGLCSREPLVTVEVLNAEPIKYEYVNPNKMRQIFKRHIIAGEIQTSFVLAKGSEVTK